MSIKEIDLLRYAASLHEEGGSDEVVLRASVGRAYYAAMHRCRQFHGALADAGGLPKNGRHGSHSKLIHQLLNPAVKHEELRRKSIALGLELRGMKELRQVADYDLHLQVTALDAKDMLEQAELIFESTESRPQSALTP